MALEDPSILAVITNDPLEVAVPLLPRDDTATLAEKLLQWAG